MTFVAATIAFDSNKKPPCPKPGQARRLVENGVGLCISVVQCPVRRSLFTFTLFHVRKVHENLIGTQPAHRRIARFFSSYARQFTYTLRIAVIDLFRRTARRARARVGKRICRIAPDVVASKRVNCRLGVCDLDLTAVRCARPAAESGSRYAAWTLGLRRARRPIAALTIAVRQRVAAAGCMKKTLVGIGALWRAAVSGRSSEGGHRDRAEDRGLTLLMRRECMALNYRAPTCPSRLRRARRSIPVQRAAGLVFDDAGLEEVALFFQVDHLAHPRERIFFLVEQRLEADLGGAAVGDEAQIAFEHGGVQTEHAAWHGVFGVGVFQVHGLQEQLLDLFLEGWRPQQWIFHLDGVDQVDAEVAMHRFVAQDVLVLLGRTHHLVLAAQRQDLGEAHVEEQAFHQAGEHDQGLEQFLVAFHGAGGEGGVGQGLDERDQEFILVADRFDFVVGVEDLRFVQAQRLHDVLVGVGMDRLLERLAQQVLAALGRRDVAVGAQHDVVGGQRVGGHKKAQVALDQATLVVGQAVRVFPQLDVALHIDFLRHPVVGAAGQSVIPHRRAAALAGIQYCARLAQLDPGLRRDDGAEASGARLHRGGLLAGFAFLETVVARTQVAGFAVFLGGRGHCGSYRGSCGDRRYRSDRHCRFGAGRHAAIDCHGVQGAGLRGRLLGVGGRGGAQVVRGFQAAQPCQFVGLVQFFTRRAGHVDVQRLGLVDPLLAPRSRFHQPAWRDFERGGVDVAQVVRDAVDLGQRAVEVFQVGDHDFIPQVAGLQVAHQVAVDLREFARQVRFHVQVLERRFDTGRHADDVRNGGRRCDRHAVRVTHAELGDAFAHRGPVHGRGQVLLEVAAAFIGQQLDRVLRQDAAVPQRTFVRRVVAAFFGQFGRGQVGVVAHRFHRRVGKVHALLRGERHAHHVQAVLEAHHAHAHRTVAHIGVACFFDGVVVDIDDVIEHAHRGADGLLQFHVIELALFHVRRQVDRTEVADGDFVRTGVQGDLGAQVRAVDHAHVRLRRTDVAWVLERDPRVAGFEQHRQHLAPQVQRGDLLEYTDFAGGSAGFVSDVRFFEGLADQVVQVRRVRWREQGPVALLHHALHEQVGNPVGRVHVVGAAAVVARVLAQVQELFDVHVPGFQVRAHRALALAALVHRHGGVVDHFQERHHALRFAVGALDVGAQRAHRGPVVTEAAGKLGQQRVFLDGVVDAFQVVRHGGQVARRQLRTQGARVEQGRRGRHEVERRQQVVELDGARFAVLFIERQAHGHAHVERLRHFDAHVAHVQEVAVVQGLQADVTELQVAVGDQRLGQAFQVELGQLGVQQFVLDAVGDVLREVRDVFGGSGALRDFLAEDFLADRVQQDAGRHLRVGRVFFHQRARRQDGGLVQLFDRHAVVQVFQGFGQDGVGIDVFFQADAGSVDQACDAAHFQRLALAVFQHVDLRRGDGGGAALRFLGQTALFHVLGAVQHVGAGHVMFARAHQRQFHLVLHVFDVERAARRLAPHERGHHAGGELLYQFADAGRGGALATVHGQEGLGHGDRDFRRFKRDDRAVAADDAVVTEVAGGRGRAAGGARSGCWDQRWIEGGVLSRLH
uniref:Uncharacterized protein n=1 Tax=Tanacetum cinerariifolium TaxID=118510 RepID=A0A699GDQ0_TANCI|nr:hypothetical protein [Tanacetum cinerariifolium]